MTAARKGLQLDAGAYNFTSSRTYARTKLYVIRWFSSPAASSPAFISGSLFDSKIFLCWTGSACSAVESVLNRDYPVRFRNEHLFIFLAVRPLGHRSRTSPNGSTSGSISMAREVLWTIHRPTAAPGRNHHAQHSASARRRTDSAARFSPSAAQPPPLANLQFEPPGLSGRSGSFISPVSSSRCSIR